MRLHQPGDVNMLSYFHGNDWYVTNLKTESLQTNMRQMKMNCLGGGGRSNLTLDSS